MVSGCFPCSAAEDKKSTGHGHGSSLVQPGAIASYLLFSTGVSAGEAWVQLAGRKRWLREPLQRIPQSSHWTPEATDVRVMGFLRMRSPKMLKPYTACEEVEGFLLSAYSVITG